MIYISSPDFEYLEKVDELESWYQKYNEIKGNKEEVQNMLKHSGRIRTLLISEVLYNSEIKAKTLFADGFKEDITVRKHTRYSPDIEHDHTFFEMIYVLKGKADNTIENTLYKMTEGDICLIPPNVYHKLWVGDESIIINFIMKISLFDESFMNDINKGSMLGKYIKMNLYINPVESKKFLMFHSLHNASVRNLLALIITEAFKGKNASVIKRALIIAIFNYLNDMEDNDDEITEKNDIIYSILEYIHKNYATVTLSDAAEHFNYSEPYFSKYIKKMTGISFMNILQTAKLKESCYLLATTNISVNSISERVGYDNVSYFNRIFKKNIGTTPYKYRKMYKDDVLSVMEGMNLT